jgi:hypothetical protein
LGSTLVYQARRAAKIAPVVLVAVRAFRSARHRGSETLPSDRSSIAGSHDGSSTTMRHEHRHTGIVTLALVGGAVLGGAAALLLAPRSGAESRARVVEQVEQRWPQLDRVPAALRAARDAVRGVLRNAFVSAPTPAT